MNECRGSTARWRWFVVLCLGTWLGCDEPTAPPAIPSPVSLAPKRVDSPTITFEDVAEACGVRFTHRTGTESDHCTILESLGGGVGVVDFDRDGRRDLFFPGGGSIATNSLSSLPGSLWRQVDKWQFVDATRNANAAAAERYSHGVTVGDFDNDGFADLVVTGYGGLQFLRNQGDGTFLSCASELGLTDTMWSTSAGFADIDNDGALDLYVTHYVDWSFENHPFCRGPKAGQRDICPPKMFNPLADILYVNQGDGTFRDASRDAGLLTEGKGLGVLLTDVDDDHDVDIYVANDTTANFLYINDGHGHFQETATICGAAFDPNGTANGSMGVDVGDYNCDGRPDIWVTNFEHEAHALYENRGEGNFYHRSDTTGVSSIGQLFVGFGTSFLDVDLDGDEDLAITNGHVIKFPLSGSIAEQPVLLLNQDRKRYARVNFAPDSFFSKVHRGRGLATSDLDDDGDIDLVIAHSDEPVAVLRNEGPVLGNYLRIRLIGTRSNRDAIGSHLELKTDAGSQHRWTHGGGSYLSRGDERVVWGISQDQKIQELELTWPNGVRQTIRDIQPNSELVLLEPAE